MLRTTRRLVPLRWPAAVALLLVPTAELAAQTRATPVPAPHEVFGFVPGADHQLADHDQMLAYFQRLAEASDRVVLREIGRSVQGRPMILAFISDPANLRELETHRRTSESLARGRLSGEAAARAARDGRAVVWLDGGLHATEVAGAQHMPKLAYHLVTDESEESRRIRREVILLLMPVMNPDGLDIVVSWYRGNVGTPYEVAPLPWLYQHYTGHDNNRDWFMITQPETQAVTRVLYHEWYPQIVYNHHQVAPFPARIFVPPFADPVNPNIPPAVVAGVNLVGAAMAQRFADEGKPGVVSRVRFDMWWNGGMRTAPYYHNMIGILTETALWRYATPRHYDRDSLPALVQRSNVPSLEASVFHPDPWQGGWWRLSDAVDYMMTASLAVLDIAAQRREAWLFGMHQMARDAIGLGERGGPYAYVVAPEQHDPWAARELLDVMRRGGVEVHRAREPFQAGGRTYPAGTYVLPAAQPFRAHLVDLLEPQVYPDRRTETGVPDRPYDLSGWTLPLQMGVRVDRIDERFDAAVDAVQRPAVPVGALRGEGRHGWLLDPGSGASVIAANRLLAAGEHISRIASPFARGAETYVAGSYVVRAGADTRERVAQLAAELGLEFTALDGPPPVATHELRAPRIGLYRSWVASIDEGWSRFVLEHYNFPYDTLRDADIRDGDLTRYDVVVLPHQTGRSIYYGHGEDSMPARYAGGLGESGVAALERYVRGGGTLIALDGATEFAIGRLGLPVRNVVADVPATEFAIPGSLLRIDVDNDDPLGWGMTREAVAYFVSGRAFAPLDANVRAAARSSAPLSAQAWSAPVRFARSDLLASGWALGADEHIGGQAAVVRVPLGAGEVILYGIRPQFRAQPHGTFKLLFNALHGAALAASVEAERAEAVR